MTLPVYLRAEAEGDVTEAASWYESRSRGLGHEFLDEIAQALSKIADRPLSYVKVHKSIRRALIRRFPFGVYYLNETTRIVVIAVMHGSRDPAQWKVRR